MSTSADASVLVLHYGSGSKTILGVKISCECRYSWNTYYDFVSLSILVGSDNSLHDCSPEFVSNRMLRVVCCCDEKLILNVDKMLAIMNNIDVCICD